MELLENKIDPIELSKIKLELEEIRNTILKTQRDNERTYSIVSSEEKWRLSVIDSLNNQPQLYQFYKETLKKDLPLIFSI